ALRKRPATLTEARSQNSLKLAGQKILSGRLDECASGSRTGFKAPRSLLGGKPSWQLLSEFIGIILNSVFCLLTPSYLGASLLLGFSATVSVASQPQQIAQATSSEGINRPALQVGSKGERVTELQAALKLLGFYTGTVDGVYSESTVLAVSRFQEAAGLKADGIVDATTWQQLFPGEPTVASSRSSSGSTSRFPAPSATSTTNQVVVPTSNSRPTTTSTATSKVEPRPTTSTATSNTTATTPKPEPRPTTSTATTSTRGDNSNPEPRPATRNTTASSQRTYVRQSISTGSGSTRSEQTIRTQQSSRPSSTTRTQQISSIQYTSEGLPILRLGMRGSEVVRLQRRLQRLGLLNVDQIDGDFGASTEAAVIALQKRYGIDADGVAGGATWEILMRR
ncbi:MAG: peptidoglycan-binding domain-containing protein, partial [Brasilonema sp.]